MKEGDEKQNKSLILWRYMKTAKLLTQSHTTISPLQRNLHVSKAMLCQSITKSYNECVLTRLTLTTAWKTHVLIETLHMKCKKPLELREEEKNTHTQTYTHTPSPIHPSWSWSTHCLPTKTPKHIKAFESFTCFSFTWQTKVLNFWISFVSHTLLGSVFLIWISVPPGIHIFSFFSSSWISHCDH